MNNDWDSLTDFNDGFMRTGSHNGGSRVGPGNDDDAVSTKSHAVVSWPVFLLVAIPIVVGIVSVWASF